MEDFREKITNQRPIRVMLAKVKAVNDMCTMSSTANVNHSLFDNLSDRV